MIETIAAIATPPGKGGVGIIRISGPAVPAVAKALAGILPSPRYALFSDFKDKHGHVIDQGIVLYFKAPHSFTGEEVLELQGHGGPVVLDQLLKCVLETEGVRLAQPGEFSQQAFLNNKMDLAQAEAVADLINATSEQAARSAMRSLEGEFSKKINWLLEKLIKLRVYIEAAIDFPEEEIDFIENSTVKNDLEQLIAHTESIFKVAQQGALLSEGMTIVIAGKPNSGKSSLLNALSGRDSAIVTEIPGTTRDILREQIVLEGLPLHVIDTAGLHETHDIVEQEGIRRAKNQLKTADLIVWMHDARENNLTIPEDILALHLPVLVVWNKIDLTGESPIIIKQNELDIIKISVQKTEGLNLLIHYLKQRVGFEYSQDNTFIARRRHLTALERALAVMKKGLQQLHSHRAHELLAEDLTQAQRYLSEITGAFSSDNLLGEIFSSFCIGK